MSKAVLFLVHGIGRQKKGWSEALDGPVPALEAAMQNYACFAAGDKLSKYLDVVEIRYDDIFDDVLKQWSDLAASLPAASGFDWLDSVNKVLVDCGNDSNTFARFGGDVLIYKGFDLIARAVRLRVNSVITAKMHRVLADASAAGSAAPPFAVAAHSMGTAVAQDALFQLATNTWREDRTRLNELWSNNKLRPISRFVDNPNLTSDQRADFNAVLQDQEHKVPVGINSLFLVSDTSPLLHRAAGLYSHHQPTPGSFDCRAVCTIAHDLDPVCKIGSAGFSVLQRPSAVTISVKHMHDKNIHGFGHYLSHPRVHETLFSRLIPELFLPEFRVRARQLAEQPEWNDLGGALADLEEVARQALRDKLIAIGAGSASVASLRGAIEKFFKIVDVA